MAEESSEDVEWLLEPPQPGSFELIARAGEGVELNEDQRAALEAVVQAFHQEDVEGYTSRVGDFCLARFCPVNVIVCPVRFFSRTDAREQ